MLRTRITERFGLRYPVMSAPMGGHSGGTLAAAVSEAGGLGMFGGTTRAGADWVRDQIRLVRARTERIFGVGFITPFIPFTEAQFDIALEERVPVIGLSFADPQPWLDRAKATGAAVMCQVQSLAQAREAVAGGADVIVAQGNEAGGHAGEADMLPLLTRVAAEFSEVPVLAAGGISSGRALAAALVAGADGAWVGTAFLATPEAIEVSDAHKQCIVESEAADTVYTRIFDIIEGLPWPKEVGARVRRNRLYDEWVGREAELEQKRDDSLKAYLKAQEKQDTDVIGVYMGEGVGDVTAVRPAAEVLRSICADAEGILRERSGALLA